MRRDGRNRQRPDVARRAWTRAERRVVLHGFFGRLTVAIEPLIAAIFFALLPVGLFLRQREIALVAAPIFAFAALAFLAYAIALMVPCSRALLETFAPIYTIDGYVSYRATRDRRPEYSVAVLSADGEILGEWPLREWPRSIGTRDVWPVMVEFSPYGGIHKIDGHSTGVLPDDIAALGVGVAARDRERSLLPEPPTSAG